MIEKLARWSFGRPGTVLLIWAAVFLATLTAATKIGDNFSLNLGLKNSDSQTAIDIVKDDFSESAGASSNVIFKAEQGVNDANTKRTIEDSLQKVSKVEGVQSISSPYEANATQRISQNSRIGYATIHFATQAKDVPKTSTRAIKQIVSDANKPGLQVEVGGEPFALNEGHGSKEFLGIVAAAIILLVAFGSLSAMGIPILTAILSVGIGAGVVSLLSNVIPMSDARQLVAMIGLGVGIDYALLLVTRFRQELASGFSQEKAAVITARTAGKSVVFAGITVVISLLGMILMNISIVQGLGLVSAVVVALSILASMTLVPALLAYFGVNMKPFSVRHNKKGAWYRWGRFIERRALLVLIAGIALTSALSLPALKMSLGSSDAGAKPTSQTIRRAYDLQAEGFGIGSNGPLLLVAKLPNGNPSMLETLRGTIATDPNVASVSPVIFNSDKDAAMLSVIPKTAPQDYATSQLVERLRNETIPQVTGNSGPKVYVGGLVASYDDVANAVSQRLPIFIAAVLGLSFLLLTMVFRSLLIPLKAIVLNMLSVGAAYGVLVAVFQWGWFKNVSGIAETGPIESFLPIMLFAILFGLSMDYEVFLLSRIKEAYAKTKHTNTAIIQGLSSTARVITAAAAIMIAVFVGFALSEERVIKEFGVGMAAAVFIDATIVRLMLVPAAMELFGKRNWWFPKWLKWLPGINKEQTPELQHKGAKAFGLNAGRRNTYRA